MNRKHPWRRRGIVVTILVTQQEYDAMNAMWRKTTCRSFSEYARKVLAEEPVATTYRNASLDALIGELNELRSQLERLTAGNPRHQESELTKNILHEVKLIAIKINERCIPQ